MPLYLRKNQNTRLSIEQLDGNFTYLESISGGTGGTTGPAGEQGVQGEQGIQGATGPAGSGGGVTYSIEFSVFFWQDFTNGIKKNKFSTQSYTQSFLSGTSSLYTGVSTSDFLTASNAYNNSNGTVSISGIAFNDTLLVKYNEDIYFPAPLFYALNESIYVADRGGTSSKQHSFDMKTTFSDIKYSYNEIIGDINQWSHQMQGTDGNSNFVGTVTVTDNGGTISATWSISETSIFP